MGKELVEFDEASVVFDKNLISKICINKVYPRKPPPHMVSLCDLICVAFAVGL